MAGGTLSGGAESGGAGGAESLGFRAAAGRRVVITLRGNPCLDDSLDIVEPLESGGPDAVARDSRGSIGVASNLHEIVGDGMKGARHLVGEALKGARSANAVLRRES